MKRAARLRRLQRIENQLIIRIYSGYQLILCPCVYFQSLLYILYELFNNICCKDQTRWKQLALLKLVWLYSDSFFHNSEQNDIYRRLQKARPFQYFQWEPLVLFHSQVQQQYQHCQKREMRQYRFVQHLFLVVFRLYLQRKCGVSI